jgi:uncharacterized caspase-like protein
MADSGRYALVVSSSRYAHSSLRPLSSPTYDADSLAELLRDRDVGAFRVRPVTDQPSWVVAQEVETFFCERRLDDLALFYFSGHGIKDEDGALYFAAMNTDPSSLLATTVSSEHVIKSMRKCRSRRQVLILDCCYAGAFSKSMLAKGTERVGIQERFATDGSGRVVLAASDAMQIALDGQEVLGEPTLSAFTRTLVDGIRDGDADQDHDGHISLDELYDYIYARMQTDHPGQTPTISNLDKKGRIVIALNPRAARAVVEDEREPEPVDTEEREEALVSTTETGSEQITGSADVEVATGLLEKLTDAAQAHRRLTIGVGVAVLVGAIVAVVLAVLGGNSSEWSLADVSSDVLDGSPPPVLAGITALPGGDAAVAVGRNGNRPGVWAYDGTSWARLPQTAVDSGTGQMRAVARSGSDVVAVGNIVASSNNIDAMTWRRYGDDRWVRTCALKDCGGTRRQEMLAVAPIAGGLIAVGRDASTGRFDGAAWRSHDHGSSWQRIARNDGSLAGPLDDAMRGVVQVGGRIVAVGSTGSDGAIWASANGGDTWTRVLSNAILSTPGHRLELLAVEAFETAGGPRLIVVGREFDSEQRIRAAAWYSDDGQSWSKATIPNARFSDQQMIDVVADQQELIAVGNAADDRAGVWRSTDGTGWSAVTSSSFRPQSGMAGIARLGDGTGFAVGTAIWVHQSG